MRRLLFTDYLLLGATLLTVVVGVTMIYSATFHSETGSLQQAWRRQGTIALVALFVALFLVTVPNRVLYSIAYPLYAGVVLLLAAVLVWGTGDLAARWLRMGPLYLQPSEFAKITTIVALAHFLSDYSSERVNRPIVLVGAMIITMIPMLMVMLQPDLGTAVVYGALLLPMLYWAGMRCRYIFVLLLPLMSVVFAFEQLWQTPLVFASFMIISTIAVHFLMGRGWITGTLFGINLTAGLVTVYLWDSLHNYQKQRILTFLNPESDPQNTGWNIIQSKISIGSGGLLGKGLLSSTQTELEFLPAAHTDFIFSVIGEELGFLGAMAILALFAFLIIRALYISAVVKSRFFSLVAVGTAAMFTFHVFVNIGMTIGVMPVTGLPLPFLSYGGSSLMANCLAIGLLLHISAHRHEY